MKIKAPLYEIKPNTNYIVFLGTEDWVPNTEQLDHSNSMMTPLFEEKGSKCLIVGASAVPRIKVRWWSTLWVRICNWFDHE